MLDKTSEVLLKYLTNQHKSGVHEFNRFEDFYNGFMKTPYFSKYKPSPIEAIESLKSLKSGGFINCSNSETILESIKITHAGRTYFELKLRSNIEKFLIPALVTLVFNILFELIKYSLKFK